jgi:2-keto-4-pentenoate hydratase/2-oxohepta-3-ene-1,7-dioic acid hydratase in catechol pathway
MERIAAEGVADVDARDLAAPYVPRQVFCTGANYRKHVIGLIMGDPSMRTAEHEGMSDDERRAHAERTMDQRAKAALPFCFIKLPSCVVGPNDPVVLPRNVEKPDWELELGVVIGKRARHVTPEAAMDHVAGFVVVNDVTAREHIFRRDGSAIGADWLSGKCFPTFLPFGPMVVPKQFVANPYDLNIRLAVNGKIYQDESTSDMMINIERQVAFLSDRVELMPGDVICTGSPYGNGSAFGVYLQPGDVMEGTITGLGTQRNPCVAE